ncbi:glycosyltransferase [Colwellia sp. C1TZA3]|uniref:glycosyltransferase n=1 Tax=Colwellia sp. C1TZA3 TaxID=2508879 RepID=UPI0011B9FEED|nr:glycosyltransferase [Colwellia sp. C1TZA3]TWX63726.1 glycosyltransferase [Colwellia sp. C1TZA3]
MKIAILANNTPSFIKPMATGLQNMLSHLSVQSEIFDNGLAMLNYSYINNVSINCKNFVKSGLNILSPKTYYQHQKVTLQLVKQFEAQLNGYDAIIVVCNIPDAFLKQKLHRIEQIRQQQNNVPIILYQNYYLATRGNWSNSIIKAGGFGLERYDWYLAASISSIYPLSKEEHPYSVIGHDLRDDILIPKTGEKFKVLLDFKRKGFEKYRALQIQALEESNIAFTELSGRYSQNEIKKIYQEHSALFLSFKESFGLPIVENQLCGNYIFTPFSGWVASHYLNKQVNQGGEGQLGDNFIVYNNNLEELKDSLLDCKKKYNAVKNYQQFKLQYSAFYQGDLIVLKKCLDKLRCGEIHSNSHIKYLRLNKDIVNDKNCKLNY